MTRSTSLVLTGILILASGAAAQSPWEKIGYGCKGGFDISGVSGYRGSSSSRTGYLIGGIFNWRENKYFTFQMELLLISKGYRIHDAVVTSESGDVLGTGNFEVILTYLEFPLLAKFTLPVGEKYVPYLSAGGFLALAVDSKLRLTGDIPFDFDLENAEDLDLGPAVGIGVDAKAGNGNLSIEIRYDSSFMTVLTTEDQKSQVLLIQFGYWW